MTDDGAARRTVGANVRAEMARHRITQDQLATALGISQPQVSKRLLGEIAFDVDELEIASRLLGVPASTFLPQPQRVEAAP